MLEFLRRIDLKLKEMSRARPWLAEKSGVKLSTINTWFFRNSYPRTLEAFQVAQVLQVSMEYLMTGKDAMPAIKEYDDPLAEELHVFIEGMTTEELREFRGWAKAFRHISLLPQPFSKKEKAG